MPGVGAVVPSSRFDLARADVAALEALAGEPPFRARQVWAALHQGLDPEEMTDVPKALRRALADALPPALRPASESVGDGGSTTKWLWQLRDGTRVETVLMRYPGRATACVSTQAGCAMACAFCATGQAGFTRHLTAAEIFEQIVRARRAARPGRLDNVVFMGMGEPLAN
jgi:23S rRNA (adenine2503-C2)-methyltransferase